MENWIELKEYNGKYFVSDLGRIKVIKKNGTEKNTFGYISNTNQYYKIGLYSNGKTKTYEVHKLVAICFLNHTPNNLKLVVDHKDNNKLNNKVCNLQIVTQRLNAQKNRVNVNNILGIKKKPSGKFEASIKINGKKVYLGLFETDLKAGAIYQKANNSLSLYENPKQFREFLQN